MSQAAGPVPSPCINICRMDAVTGWCEGCLRSLDEIATWSGLNDLQRRSVVAQLPARRWQRRQQLAAVRAVNLAVSAAAVTAAAAATAAAPTTSVVTDEHTPAEAATPVQQLAGTAVVPPPGLPTPRP
jgi:predicted Fe-S protein YdhL (DUF1289 family)